MRKNQLKLRLSISVIFLLVCLTATVKCDTTVVANFDAYGIKGKITFKQTAVSLPTNITVSLNGLASAAEWKITSGFLNGNGDNNCNSANIGSVYNPFQVPVGLPCDLQNQQTSCSVGNLTSRHGLIPVNGQATFQGDVLIDLNGNQSIAGRTLTIQGMNKWLCAPLIPSGELITMSSRMEGQVQGRILFRQLQSSTTSTTLYLNLAALHSYQIGTIYNWQIRNACNASAAYAPNGDLTTKHSTLNIDPTLTTNKFLINDANLPLTGSGSIGGKYIVLFTNANSNVVKSCGKITRIMAKSVEAIINTRGITGSIRLQQNSEFDPVRLHVSLNNLNSLATTYGIYQYPVGLKLSSTDNPCNRLGQLYNPTNINTQHNSMNPLPLGDLSGKFGNLTNQLAVNTSYTDYSLQLFGPLSVVGRSIAVQFSSQNSAWICSTINYPKMPMIRARIRFVFPVVGEIIFIQHDSDPYSDTSLYISVSQSGRYSPSLNHNWHIHTLGELTDVMSTSGRCASAAGHYNPSVVNVSASDYKARCRANHLLCELGDLSTRQGAISIGNQVDRFFLTDINTPLSGKYSILDRSVVIHAKQYGAPRIACGKILKLSSGSATANLESYGQISVKQFDPSSITMVHLNLKSLNSAIKGIYIGSTPRCVSNDIFNPFNQVSPAIMQGTNDQYPVGNLTGKLNVKLDDVSTVDKVYQDSNLPLYGMASIIGRSVAMIDKVSNTIRQCAVLQRAQIATSFVVKGVATFTGPIAIGTITLTQTVYSKSFASSETTMYIQIRRNQSMPISFLHNWHVHVQPVYKDSAAAQGRCQSTQGHYNPFLVNVTKPAYSQQCGHNNPLRCEVGDSSSKTERLNITDNFQLLTKDTYLPLTGLYTVLGRSIVIHAKNGGASRIGCADIVPQAGSHSALITLPNVDSRKYNITTLRSTVKSIVGNGYDTVYPVQISGQNNCQNIKFYLVGYNAASKTSTINALVQSNSTRLGDYKPMKACSTTGSGQAPLPSLLLVCFVTMLVNIFGH